MRKFQKGQAIVEFALVLPFLILFIIGLMYFGLMFSNYVSMNNIAREVARSAAMLSDDTYKDTKYQTIHNMYHSRALSNSSYLWNPGKNADQLKIEYVKASTDGTALVGNGEVVVTLTATINPSIKGPFSNVLGDTALDNLVVEYRMYSEVAHTVSSEGE